MPTINFVELGKFIMFGVLAGLSMAGVIIIIIRSEHKKISLARILFLVAIGSALLCLFLCFLGLSVATMFNIFP